MILDLVVAGRGTRLTHRLTVGPDSCTLLLGVHDGVHEEVQEAPDLVPAALVRLTRLRPRKHAQAPSPLPVDGDLVAALLGTDVDVRREVLATLGADFAWQISGDGVLLTAIDGPLGVHLLAAGAFEPATNTEVYRRFLTYVSVADSTPSTSSAPAPSRAAVATSEPDGSVHQ